MGMESYKLGREGEKLAEEYLSRHGYRIIDRNYRSQQGEIDLVAQDGHFLTFVEVKNYSFRSLGSPLGAVRRSKRDSIVHAAKTYLQKMTGRWPFCRFDVLIIYRSPGGESKIELYKDAFRC